uniref:L-gulonolactone oxidase n=1 Tax=Kalanchoe fedtschenkoi TaxID=63787 RepID=A0A7N0URF0_KALFE
MQGVSFRVSDMFLLRMILFCLCLSAPEIYGMPPEDPIRCDGSDCVLSNAYGSWLDRRDCHVSKVAYPATEQELVALVAGASKNSQKVKVVSAFSHTIPKLACPDQTPGALLISTAKYNSNIELDLDDMAVTADAGVGLRSLIDRVEEANVSLAASPYWEGVSIGGLISTGSHGSSWWGRGGSVHDHVVGLILVVPASASEGHAKVLNLKEGDPLLKAAKVSLGLLGVISKVKLRLEPGFKRSVTFNFTDDSSFENEFTDLAKSHEFADITWYPSRKTAVYRYDDRVPLITQGDGSYDFLGFQSNSVLISESVRFAEKQLEKAKSVKGKCAVAATTLAYKKLIANGLKNDKLLFSGYPVVGRQGKMQTAGSCLYTPEWRKDVSCAWDPRISGLFFYESTAIFPASRFAGFIRDVRKLRGLMSPDSFCGVDVYNGFLIRFIKASDAYLGQSEDSVVVDFNYYRADEATTPRLSQDVWEEVEQLAFFKHGAKPHWAKNRNLAFLNVHKKYQNYDKFLAAKKQLDPDNLFSSGFSDDLLMGKAAGMTKTDGCALEGQCVCSEDRHCSPQNGYLCKPGLVYTEARVCRSS